MRPTTVHVQIKGIIKDSLIKNMAAKSALS